MLCFVMQLFIDYVISNVYKEIGVFSDLHSLSSYVYEIVGFFIAFRVVFYYYYYYCLTLSLNCILHFARVFNCVDPFRIYLFIFFFDMLNN